MSGKRIPPVLPGQKGDIIYVLLREYKRIDYPILICYDKEFIEKIAELESGWQPHFDATLTYKIESFPANDVPERIKKYHWLW